MAVCVRICPLLSAFGTIWRDLAHIVHYCPHLARFVIVCHSLTHLGKKRGVLFGDWSRIVRLWFGCIFFGWYIRRTMGGLLRMMPCASWPVRYKCPLDIYLTLRPGYFYGMGVWTRKGRIL